MLKYAESRQLDYQSCVELLQVNHRVEAQVHEIDLVVPRIMNFPQHNLISAVFKKQPVKERAQCRVEDEHKVEFAKEGRLDLGFATVVLPLGEMKLQFR